MRSDDSSHAVGARTPRDGGAFVAHRPTHVPPAASLSLTIPSHPIRG